MPPAPANDPRRFPRIEHLDHSVHFALGNEHYFPRARLRDLAINSMRIEILGEPSAQIGHSALTEMEAHVPDLGLYLRCQSRVARTYARSENETTVQGLALEFIGLNAATRGQIRALHTTGRRRPGTLA